MKHFYREVGYLGISLLLRLQYLSPQNYDSEKYAPEYYVTGIVFSLLSGDMNRSYFIRRIRDIHCPMASLCN